jgi:hypothetical protein
MLSDGCYIWPSAVEDERAVGVVVADLGTDIRAIVDEKIWKRHGKGDFYRRRVALLSLA